MVNWKTTVAGICSAIPQIIPLLGIAAPIPILNAVSAVFAAVAFFLAKDGDVTGGERAQ